MHLIRRLYVSILCVRAFSFITISWFSKRSPPKSDSEPSGESISMNLRIKFCSRIGFLFVLCRVCDSKLIRDVIHLHICNFIDLWTSTYYAYEFVLFCCCSQPTRSDQVLVNNLSMWSMSGYHSTLYWCMYLNDAASVTRPIASRDFRRKIKESFYKESEEIQKIGSNQMIRVSYLLVDVDDLDIVSVANLGYGQATTFSIKVTPNK